MPQEQKTILQPKGKTFPQRIDDLVKIFIPNFNVRAVLYMTLIFAFVLFMRIWKF
jgi:hypothetical protein